MELGMQDTRENYYLTVEPVRFESYFQNLTHPTHMHTGGRPYKNKGCFKFYYGMEFKTRTQVLEEYETIATHELQDDFYLVGSYGRKSDLQYGPDTPLKEMSRKRMYFIPLRIIKCDNKSARLGRATTALGFLPEVSQFIGKTETVGIVVDPRAMRAIIEVRVGTMPSVANYNSRADYFLKLTDQLLRNNGMQINWPDAMWQETPDAELVIINCLKRIVFNLFLDAKVLRNMNRVKKVLTEVERDAALYIANPNQDPIESKKKAEIDRMEAEFMAELLEKELKQVGPMTNKLGIV